MRQCARLVGYAIVFGLALCESANAQGTTASAGNASAEGHRLELAGSLTGAYDDDVPAELQGTLDPTGLNSGGFSTMLVGSANYGWTGRRYTVSGTGSSVSRYYAEFDRIRSISQSASIGGSARLPSQFTAQLSQTASYTPSYLYSLFPQLATEAVPTAPLSADYTISDSASYNFGTTAGLTRPVGRQNDISFTGGVNRTDFVREGLRRDVSVYDVGSDYSHAFTRNTSLTLGYRYRAGEYIYGDVSVEEDPTPEWQTTGDHSINVGMRISRALSRTRRATFQFGVGASTLRAPSEDRQQTYEGHRIVGHLDVGYQLARTWQVRGVLNRGTEYVAELGEPILLTGFSTFVNGGLTRRVNFSASGQYSQGESALRRDTVNFDTYAANVRVTFDVAPLWSTYGEYAYYFYDFTNASVAASFPSSLERGGVRAGLTLRLPMGGK
jgi:hypothetical protein